jgi:hypothetical protein
VRVGAAPLVTTIFPNFSWLASPVFFFIRTWQPIGPSEIELRTWTLTHPDATAEQRRMRDQTSNLTFGLTGMLEQDDMVIWSRIQRAHQGVVGGEEMVNYTCTRPVDKSHFLPDGRDWPGPGEIRQGFPSDDPLWNFHLRWLHLMRGGQP